MTLARRYGRRGTFIVQGSARNRIGVPAEIVQSHRRTSIEISISPVVRLLVNDARHGAGFSRVQK